MLKSRVASGRRFGLGLCAIALVLACEVDKRTYRDLVEAGSDASGRPQPGADAAPPPDRDASPGAEAGPVPSAVPDASNDAQTDTDTGPAPSLTAPSPDAGHDAGSNADGGDSSLPLPDASSSGDSGADAAPLPDDCGNTDPDCECVDGMLAPRDQDEDGHAAQACEAAPGDDCDDADGAFVTNACGGCSKDLDGLPGNPCLDCGVLACAGPDEFACVDPEPLPRRCFSYQPEVCSQGTWTTAGTCSSATQYCDEGTGQCASVLSSVLSSSVLSSSVLSSSVVSSSYSVSSVYSSSTAYLQEGPASPRKLRSAGCTYALFHPRDESFEVGNPSPQPASPTGIPTGDVLDRATGFEFG
jgi:hypothetical protein